MYTFKPETRLLLPAFVVALLAALLLPLGARSEAASPLPGQAAEQIRSALLQAQLAQAGDPAAAQAQLARAAATYQAALQPTLAKVAPASDAAVAAGLAAATQALAQRDAAALAAARARVWTALLAGGYASVGQAIASGDAAAAKAWLSLREFKHATRVSRPGADATLAVNAFAAGTLAAEAARAAVDADLLGTYQARLSDAVHDMAAPAASPGSPAWAEAAALAEGYGAMLAPAFALQQGVPARESLLRDLRLLTQAQTHSSADLRAGLSRVGNAVAGFQAAPLTDAERVAQAGKVNRYLGLVAPNYGRGMRNGQVVNQIEIEEARTFRSAAEDALATLLPDLQRRDAAGVSKLQAALSSLGEQIEQHADPAAVQASADAASAQFAALVPDEWLQSNPSADFDAIRELLAQVHKAVAAGQYPQAESARLEAYAILDAGPEIRLRALAPDQAVELAGLFWQGSDSQPGLANLLADRADAKAVEATISAISTALARAQSTVGSGSASPAAVIGNAAVIIFRQGLEAVVILASIFAGLRKAEDLRFRRPLAWGAAAAGLATILTWLVLRVLLSQFAQFGGRLEAVVSIISVAVLLLILNWFFHNIYWVGWLSGIQKRKKRSLLSAETGQMVALAMVGFTSVYREGFETALFSQVLVLEAGPAIVLQGLLLGAVPVLLLGLLTLRFQAKLPYKTLLIVSGVLISSVLIQMMGQTIHAMQAVRWMTVTPLHGLAVPYWMGVWFGVYPTWEGLLAQLAAFVIVFGSYALAERQRHARPAVSAPARRQAQGRNEAAPLEKRST